MREIRPSGSEGGAAQTNAPPLPLSRGDIAGTIQLVMLQGHEASQKFQSWRRKVYIGLGNGGGNNRLNLQEELTDYPVSAKRWHIRCRFANPSDDGLPSHFVRLRV